LEDINNTRKISAVIFGGRMYNRIELNSMLDDAAKSGAANPKSK